MSILLLSSFLFSKTLGGDPNSCKFFYDERQDAPVPLDSCYWSAPQYSYGFYCTKDFNGTTYSNYQVVNLKFDAADCPGGLEGGEGYLYESGNIYDCDEWGTECNCDGSLDNCQIAVTHDCNETHPAVEQWVFDICVDSVWESSKWNCDKNKGVYAHLFSDTGCSGVQNTPSPTKSPLGVKGDPYCWQTDCGEEAKEEKKTAGGIIALIVILCLCGCLCCLIGIWYIMKKKSKQEQYFDNNATTGF